MPPGDAGAGHDVGDRLAAAQRRGEGDVGPVDHDRARGERLAPRPRFARGPRQAAGRERAGDDIVTAAPGHQSICRRMNVGISSSLSSAGGSGAARRAGAPPSTVLAYPGGGTGVGRAARSRKGSTPGAARTGVSAACRSNPVAMTVTRISPCIAGSFTVPKMISASSPAASFTTSEIWVTSPSVRSSPPVMLISTPVAPVMEMLSSSGDEIACCTASIARFSPRPMPVPMIAAPPFCITVRTSAKSTFTMPVTVMREEIPCVACSSTSSAFLSASWNGMPLPTTASSRSLGTTTMVSTCLRISAMPISAWRIRLRPSNKNGLVTMPMVRAPRSRAICEMIGAAPVPVPPPMPQVTKTRSAPCRPCRTSSRFSSMAWRPISGRAPAPRPRVSFFPICTFTSALLLSNACASVFTEMNSTPWRPSSTMRFRALPPPPPTPTTFIRAFCDTVSSSSKIMAPSGDRSEEVLQPPLQRSEPPLDARTLQHLAPPLVDDMGQQPPRRPPRTLARGGRQVDHPRRVHQRLIRHAMTLLQPLRVRLGPPQPRHHVAGDMRPRILERREVPDLSFVEDRDASRPAPHLHQGDAQLFLVVRQHRIGRGERLEHQLRGPVARPLHAAAQVLRGRGLHRHEVHLHLEPRARHPHGVRDAALLVDDVLLRDIVQQLVIASERHRARYFVHPRHVLGRDLVARHRHHPRRSEIGRAHV